MSIIAHHLARCSEKKLQPEALWHQSYLVLEWLTNGHELLIEAAQGIYTFSYLSLQEYLCASHIVTNISAVNMSATKIDTHPSDKLLEQFSQYVLDARWYEIIGLVLEMLPNCQSLVLLLQTALNQKVLGLPKIKNFLQWVNQKASITSQHLDPTLDLSVVRAFYFSIALDLGLDLTYNLDNRLAWQLPPLLAKDLDLIQLIHRLMAFATNPSLVEALHISFILQSEFLEDELGEALKSHLSILQTKIFDQTLHEWPTADLQDWTKTCQIILLRACQFDGDWQWSVSDTLLLEQYYWANIYLLECSRRFTSSKNDLVIQISQNLINV